MTVSLHGGIAEPSVSVQDQHGDAEVDLRAIIAKTFAEHDPLVPHEVLEKALRGLFPGRSRWARACAAAAWTQESPETIQRWETGKIDGRLSVCFLFIRAAVQAGVIDQSEIFGGRS